MSLFGVAQEPQIFQGFGDSQEFHIPLEGTYIRQVTLGSISGILYLDFFQLHR